jgi:hypothetical protein
LQDFLDSWHRGNDGLISIGHPDWIGIRSSARHLFSHRLYLPDSMNKESAALVSDMLREAAPQKIIIQGFPLSYSSLVESLQRQRSQAELYAIWHGSFLQAEEDYAWASFQRLLHHHKYGPIRKIGFVKKGMADVLKAAGVRAGFVMNRVIEIPSAPSTPILDTNTHVGIWGLGHNWRKLPYSMLASFLANPDWVAHVSGATPRTMEFIKYFSIRSEVQSTGIPHEKLLSTLGNMHLNLYVTLSECAPMLPLESLSVGTPCLLGPNSHYFEDDEYLRERLVVPHPDKAAVISDFARKALDERDKIIFRYMSYAPQYNQRAQDCLAKFLES